MAAIKSELRNCQAAIRVLLVEDSPIALNLLQRMLALSPEIQVVGTAENGQKALGLLPVVNPDVICTDLHMPVMDGLELTRRVMSEHPLPILVISISVEHGSANVFKLLEAGALDVMNKPVVANEADLREKSAELIAKIRILSGVRVFKRASAAPAPPPVRPQSTPRILVIGASTGGPQALLEILSRLPGNFPLPVLCVQHIGDDFLGEMIRWLNESCALKLNKAAQGVLPRAGSVYFAPENAHLELDGSGYFAISHTAPVDGHRPSVTVTMKSVARYYGNGTVGVLLSGMGRDGADGMAAIAAAGGLTIAQNEASCVVYGMPREAILLGIVQHIVAVEQIAPMLTQITSSFASETA